MDIFKALACPLINLYLIVLFVRVILSWFPINPQGTMAVVAGFLYTITDPVIKPIRRIIPPLRVGTVALDFSVLIVIVGMQWIVLPIIC